MRYELTPEYDARKSFYRKAYVEQEFNNPWIIATLYSYGTPVAALVYADSNIDAPHIYRLWGGYSATTQRHIAEFLRQNCCDFMNGKDITTKSGWAAIPLSAVSVIKKIGGAA